jgi:hypothetical protein
MLDGTERIARIARGSALCVLMTAAGCKQAAPCPDVQKPRPRDKANLFANGDFELGRPPWHDRRAPNRPFWHGFDVSETFAYHGRSSAHLQLLARDVTPRESESIVGVIQETRVETVSDPAANAEVQGFPETISGFYRVENWQRRTAKQYLQFVVIVWTTESTNIQIRYVLAGAPTPPLDLSNARYIVMGPAEPVTGAWVPFARDLRKDWLAQWGELPKRYEYFRILFEVRYDDGASAAPGHMGDVYFDDLYLGPAASATSAN